MACLATTMGPPALSPRRCIAGNSWIVRVRKPDLLLWPGLDLAARCATTSVRIEWMSFFFSCFRDRRFRGGKSASVLGFEAPEERGKADPSRTAIGTPKVELAGSQPVS